MANTTSAKIVESTNLFPVDRLTVSGTVGAPGTLQPVGAPRRIADEGWTPLAEAPDGTLLLGRPGEIARLGRHDVAPVLLDTVSGEPHCAVEASEGRIIVMADDGVRVYDAAAGFAHAAGTATAFGPVSIVAEPAETVGLFTPNIRLAQSYDVGSTLSVADTTRAQDVLNRSYRHLASVCASEGVFFQPMMARAVVRDASGVILWRGPETLIMPPSGPQLGEPVIFDFVDYDLIVSRNVEVSTYRLRVHCERILDDYFTAALGARLDIELTPQIHPWSASGLDSGQASVGRKGISGDRTVAIPLSGAHCGLSTHRPAAACRIIETLVRGFDMVSSVVATYPEPWLKGVDATVTAVGVMDVNAEAADLEALLALPTDIVDADVRRKALCRIPHTFTARKGATSGNAVLWADICVHRCGGHPALALASDVHEPWGWSAATTVTFADGSRATSVTHGTACAPAAIGPFVSYPDAEARSLDILVMEEGTTPLRWHFDLHPDVTNAFAYCLNDQLASHPGAPDAEAALPAATQAPALRWDSAVALAPASSPLSIKAMTDAGDTVIAATAAHSTNSAWDYNRNRFVVYTPSRVSLVNADIRQGSATVAPLALTGIDNPWAVCRDTVGNNYFVSHRIIYTVSGHRVSLLCMLPGEADRIGYDPTTDTLVTAHSSGTGRLRHTDPRTGAAIAHTWSAGPSNNWLSTPTRLLAATQDALVDLSVVPRMDFDGTVSISLEAPAPPLIDTRLRPLRTATWHIESTHFDGTVALERRYITDRSAAICSLRLRGSLSAPLPMPIRPSRGHLVTGGVLTLAADVAPRTTIAPPTLTY